MAEPNIAELKERARVLWGMGDYPKIAAIINPAAQGLLDACAISIFARTASWRCFWPRSVAIALLPPPERFSASF